MKEKKEKRKKGVASKFISFLWKKSQGSIDSFTNYNHALVPQRKLLSDTVYQLEKSGAVEEIGRTQKGKRVTKEFKLTEKGMMRAVKLCLEKDKLKKLVHERRLIIFDIPEKRRFYRDYFRQTMKDLDCQMVQLSVWQADFELPEDFLILVRELGLGSRVIVYRIRPEEVLYS